MAPDPEHILGRRPVTAPLPSSRFLVPGTVVVRLRDMDRFPAGSIVRATSSPAPRYFLRWGSGWLACDELGNVAEHMDMWAQLDGWPPVLPSRDVRRPITVMEVPHELPERMTV